MDMKYTRRNSSTLDRNVSPVGVSLRVMQQRLLKQVAQAVEVLANCKPNNPASNNGSIYTHIYTVAYSYATVI